MKRLTLTYAFGYIRTMVVLLFSLVFLVFFPSASSAEIYRWTDESGVVHFTDQYNKVPPEYRGTNKGQDSGTPVIEPTPAAIGISQGERLFRERCIGCHPLPRPEKFMKDDWARLLDDMDKEMEKKDIEPLTPDERATILEFLRRRSR